MPRSLAQRRAAKYRALKRRAVTNSPRNFKWLCANTTGRVGIVAEGDSWFAYPPRFIITGPNSNIIDHVADTVSGTGKANLLRLASNGDEAVNMIAGKQKHTLAKILQTNAAHIDIILFSGGGNDVVGKWDMERLLKPYQPDYSASDCVRHDRLKRKIKRITLAYQELLELRDEYCPNAVVVTHTYDKVKPSNRGARFLWGKTITGPWILPYLKGKGIPDNLGIGITDILLGAMKTALENLASKPVNAAGLKVVPTYGTLRPGHAQDWLNEIHPTPSGFKRITRLVYGEMRRIQPTLPSMA